MIESEILSFLNTYGLLFMFIIIFLEYLNMPGFPAGVIFPAVGLWTHITDASFILTLMTSILAGVMGSTTLFMVGKYGGQKVINRIISPESKLAGHLRKVEEKIKRKGNVTIFLAMLIPVLRTIIPFPAGAMKMDLRKYIIYSASGIALWNGLLIGSGAVIGNTIF